VGFTGEQVFSFGFIELSVMAGIYPRNKTIMVKFLVMDRPSGYSAILRRTALTELKAVTLTPHLRMKFSTEEGFGVQKWSSEDGPGMLEHKLEKASQVHLPR
jgi:hypothetical protein